MITRARAALPRRFWLLAALFFIYNGCFGLVLFLKPGTTAQFALLDDAGLALGLLISAGLCFTAGILSQQHMKKLKLFHKRLSHRWIPFIVGAAFIDQFLGQGLYTYFDLRQITAFPSLADVCFLSAIPLMLWATLLLPTRPLSPISRSRITLDSFMMMVTLLTFSWYFILGPTMLQSKVPLPGKLVGSAYPFFDLLLIFCVVLLTSRSIDRSLQPAIFLLSIGILLLGFTDSGYLYRNLQQIYGYGLLDLGWPLGYLLIAIAICLFPCVPAWYNSPRLLVSTTRRATDRSLLWSALLPYLLIPVFIGLGIYIWQLNDRGILAQGVYFGGVSLTILILARQVISRHETFLLNTRRHASSRELKKTQTELHSKNIELIAANQRLEELATTDPLTELPNHHSLVSLLDKELKRAKHYTQSCSIFFLDIDHFKALNDSYGHPAGDTILREFSAIIRKNLRQIDTIGRWGGEEFIAILPETTIDAALLTARKIRKIIAAHAFQVGGGVKLTCSLGLATYPEHAHYRESLLLAADKAMYAAKQGGRNKVCLPHEAASLELAKKTTENSRAVATRDGVVHSLTFLLETHDFATCEHSQHVGKLVSSLALSLGLSAPEAQMLQLAGQLHDIGKIVIPQTLLLKPDSLTLAEQHTLRLHPEIGSNVLNNIPMLRPLATIVRSHHERWDGLGYPDQLKGEAIPFGSRLIAVVDSFLLLNSCQPPLARASAFQELQSFAGTQFDPVIVEALRQYLDNASGDQTTTST